MVVSSAAVLNIRSTTTTVALVDLHRMFSNTRLYDHGKTNTLDDDDDDGRLDPRPPPPPPPPSSASSAADGGATDRPTTGAGFVFKWYAVIAILSVLVLTGIVFVVFRLSLKAEAFRKSGLDTHQDGLLFAVDGGGVGGEFCLPLDHRDVEDSNDL